MARWFCRLLHADEAATATEYAVMLALILVVILGSVALLGTGLNAEYTSINSSMFGS